jgi:hypothetical protein
MTAWLAKVLRRSIYGSVNGSTCIRRIVMAPSTESSRVSGAQRTVRMPPWRLRVSAYSPWGELVEEVVDVNRSPLDDGAAATVSGVTGRTSDTEGTGPKCTSARILLAGTWLGPSSFSSN